MVGGAGWEWQVYYRNVSYTRLNMRLKCVCACDYEFIFLSLSVMEYRGQRGREGEHCYSVRRQHNTKGAHINPPYQFVPKHNGLRLGNEWIKHHVEVKICSSLQSKRYSHNL